MLYSTYSKAKHDFQVYKGYDSSFFYNGRTDLKKCTECGRIAEESEVTDDSVITGYCSDLYADENDSEVDWSKFICQYQKIKEVDDNNNKQWQYQPESGPLLVDEFGLPPSGDNIKCAIILGEYEGTNSQISDIKKGQENVVAINISKDQIPQESDSCLFENFTNLRLIVYRGTRQEWLTQISDKQIFKFTDDQKQGIMDLESISLLGVSVPKAAYMVLFLDYSWKIFEKNSVDKKLDYIIQGYFGEPKEAVLIEHFYRDDDTSEPNINAVKNTNYLCINLQDIDFTNKQLCYCNFSNDYVKDSKFKLIIDGDLTQEDVSNIGGTELDLTPKMFDNSDFINTKQFTQGIPSTFILDYANLIIYFGYDYPYYL